MEDALVYAPHAEAQHGVRVAKRKRKTQGLEVTFDAKARKYADNVIPRQAINQPQGVPHRVWQAQVAAPQGGTAVR